MESYQQPIKKQEALPGASLQEARYFAAEQYGSTAPENTYLPEEILTTSHSPKSPF
jgi:hypothetical protein